MKLKSLALLGLITITLASCSGEHKLSVDEAVAVAQQIAVYDVTDDVYKIEKVTYTIETKTSSSNLKLVDRFDFVNLYYYRETVDLPSGIKKEWCYKKDSKYYNVIVDKEGQTFNEVEEKVLTDKLTFIREKIKEDSKSINSKLVDYITNKDFDDRKDEYYSSGEGSLKMFQKSEAGKYSFELAVVDYLPVYSSATYDGDTFTDTVEFGKCELTYPTAK